MTVNTYRTSPRRLLSGRHRDRQPVALDRAGQVPKSLNANGKFTARLKSIVTLPSSSETLVVTARHGAVSNPFVVSGKAHVSAPSLPLFAASSYAVEPNPRASVPRRMADWSRSAPTVPPGRSGAHQTVCSSPAGPIPGRPGTSIRPRTPCGSQRSGRATGWHTVRRAERVRRGDALGGPS